MKDIDIALGNVCRAFAVLNALVVLVSTIAAFLTQQWTAAVIGGACCAFVGFKLADAEREKTGESAE